MPDSPRGRWRRRVLGEEGADQLALLFFLDAGEQLLAQAQNRLGAIERHRSVNLPSGEVTGLALGLKDRLDLLREVDVAGGGRRCWRGHARDSSRSSRPLALRGHMPRLRAVESTKEESAREEQRVDPHGQDILPRSGSKDSRALSRETFSEVTQALPVS